MYLCQQLRVVERDDFLVLGYLCHVLSMPGRRLIGVVFKAAYDVIDKGISKHQLQEADLVEEEKGSDNVE